MPKIRVFDAAEYLDSPEMIAEYLTEAFETDDEVFIAKAIGTVARAQGMSYPRYSNPSSRNSRRNGSGISATPDPADPRSGGAASSVK